MAEFLQFQFHVGGVGEHQAWAEDHCLEKTGQYPMGNPKNHQELVRQNMSIKSKGS